MQNKNALSKIKQQSLQQLLQTKILRISRDKKQKHHEISPWSFYHDQNYVKNSSNQISSKYSNPTPVQRNPVQRIQTNIKQDKPDNELKNLNENVKLQQIKCEINELINERNLIKIVGKYFDISERLKKKSFEKNSNQLPQINIYKQSIKQQKESNRKHRSEDQIEVHFLDLKPKNHIHIIKFDQDRSLSLKKFSNLLLSKNENPISRKSSGKIAQIPFYDILTKKIQNSHKKKYKLNKKRRNLNRQ